MVVIPKFYTTRKISCLLASRMYGSVPLGFQIIFCLGDGLKKDRLKHVCKYFFGKELYYESSSHV